MEVELLGPVEVRGHSPRKRSAAAGVSVPPGGNHGSTAGVVITDKNEGLLEFFFGLSLLESFHVVRSVLAQKNHIG